MRCRALHDATQICYSTPCSDRRQCDQQLLDSMVALCYEQYFYTVPLQCAPSQPYASHMIKPYRAGRLSAARHLKRNCKTSHWTCTQPPHFPKHRSR